jgi:glycerophosphoryl diester phosphodiesterase
VAQQNHPYFATSPLPRILAHRGLAGPGVAENTIEAFVRAIEAGATHIESDIQVTKDGVAVLFHDHDLSRVAGVASRIEDVSAAELAQIELNDGGRVPRLEDALLQLPSARFNLDIKSDAAVAPAVEVINRLGVWNRVLVSSFSDGRRRRALAGMTHTVATSAGGSLVLLARVASAFGAKVLLARMLRKVGALQIPRHFGPIRLDTVDFLLHLKSAGVEVHFWTINDPAEMKALVELGASGIVSDRADLAVQTLLP